MSKHTDIYSRRLSCLMEISWIIGGLSAAGGSAGFLHDRITIGTYFPQNEWSCNCGLLCLFLLGLLMWLLNRSHKYHKLHSALQRRDTPPPSPPSCFSPTTTTERGTGEEEYGLPCHHITQRERSRINTYESVGMYDARHRQQNYEESMWRNTNKLFKQSKKTGKSACQVTGLFNMHIKKLMDLFQVWITRLTKKSRL